MGLLQDGDKSEIIPKNNKELMHMPHQIEMISLEELVPKSHQCRKFIEVFDFAKIKHSKLFTDKKNHINGIENFCNQVKRHMRKYNSILEKHFYLFLKECEWHFNYGAHKRLLETLKYLIKIHNQS